jgi:hypothetical protein
MCDDIQFTIEFQVQVRTEKPGRMNRPNKSQHTSCSQTRHASLTLSTRSRRLLFQERSRTCSRTERSGHTWLDVTRRPRALQSVCRDGFECVEATQTTRTGCSWRMSKIDGEVRT